MRSLQKNRKGSITVFCAITIPAVLILSMVLSDIYMLRSAKAYTQKALKVACECILSSYSSYMKEAYSIYGYEMDEEESETVVRDILAKYFSDSGILSIITEEITVERTDKLTDAKILQDQISTVMNDDIYAVLLKEVNERIRSISTMNGVFKVLRVKMQMDEVISGIQNIRAEFQIITDSINGMTEYIDLMNYVYEVQVIYASIMEKKSMEPSELLEEEIKSLTKQALRIIDENIENIIYVMKEYNRKGLELLQDMCEAYIDIHMISDSMNELINEINGVPEYLIYILEGCTELLNKTETAFSDSVFDIIRRTFNKNINELEDVCDDVSKAVTEGFVEDIVTVFNNALGGYCDIVYEDAEFDDYLNTYIDGLEYDDPRTFFQKVAEDVLKSISFDDDIIDGFVYLISDDIARRNCSFSVDTTGNTLEGILSQMDEISISLEELRESILLNEFILLFFNSYTDDDVNRNRYLDSEVEYIIFGDSDANRNLKSAKASLMGFRFLSNMLHVYSDMDKTVRAKSIASYVAGSWTFGAGTPIVENLILCSWALGESAYDVNQLFKGKSCPLYKLDGDWQLDIGIEQGTGKTPDYLKLDYEDHLRILLAITPNETKILRMLDLIALNAPGDLDMSDMYCGVYIRITVSVRSMFGLKRYISIEVTDGF
ncbi:MAG: DUF5702 domain-containing protein [Clostridia bacterium]